MAELLIKTLLMKVSFDFEEDGGMKMYETMLMVQYVGMAILVAEIVFLFFQNPSKIQRDMFLLLIALLITFVCYTMELKATDMQGQLQMAILTYLGKPMIVFAMLMLILDYCRITRPKYVTAGIFFVQVFFL